MVFLIVRYGDYVVFKSPVFCIEDTYSIVSELAKCFGTRIEWLNCRFVKYDDFLAGEEYDVEDDEEL